MSKLPNPPIMKLYLRDTKSVMKGKPLTIREYLNQRRNQEELEDKRNESCLNIKSRMMSTFQD